MMSPWAAFNLNGAAISNARSGQAARRPVFQAGQRGAGALAAVFEASCFAGLNSTDCVFADPSFVDV
jgi:hypothetical protein